MKKLALIAALLAANTAANAGVVSAAGGVSWTTTNSTPNFSATIDFTQWWTTQNTVGKDDVNQAVAGEAIDATLASVSTAPGAELVGVGNFKTNGLAGEPNCNGCELTFSFGGIFFDNNKLVNADNAWLNVYVDYDMVNGVFDDELIRGAADQDAEANLQASRAVDGTLWASLSLEAFRYTPDATYGGAGEPLISGSTSFYGNVDGGIAEENFVNGFFFGLYDAAAQGLTASFDSPTSLFLITENPSDMTLSRYSQFGSGRVSAETVSAPSTIALFGLALVGLGAMTRRRKA
jgi:hypothetical protein